MEFKKISPYEINKNAFELIAGQWALVAAQKEEKVNALTASWGGLGVLWNKNTIFIFIRQSRYTKEFIDSAETFSLTFLNHKKYAEVYRYFGFVSGRDEDKIAKQGLTVKSEKDTPYFEEGELVFICKKLCATKIEPKDIIDTELATTFYSDNDLHTMYVGEIISVLKK